MDGNFLLGSNALINLTARGYANAQGPGAGNTQQRRGDIGKGASYGGRGGFGTNTSPAACYGSLLAPEDLGSGADGRGGGAARLVVGGQACIDGAIVAHGDTVSGQNPGPSGGSIWLTAASLEGNGALRAHGDTGYQSGGGGRIAVTLTQSNTFGNVAMTAYGGAGSSPPYVRGSAGTVFMQAARERPDHGTLRIDNNNYANSAAFAVDWFTELPPTLNPDGDLLRSVAVVVTNGANVGITAPLTIGNLLWLNSGTKLYLQGNDLIVRAVEHPLGPGIVIDAGGHILWRPQLLGVILYWY
jgi:hypothetical protein